MIGKPPRAAFIATAAQTMQAYLRDVEIELVQQVMVDPRLVRRRRRRRRRRLAAVDDDKTETLQVTFVVTGMDREESGGMLAKRLYDVLDDTSASGLFRMYDNALPAFSVKMKVLAQPSVLGEAPPPEDLGLFGDSDKAAALIFIGIFIVCPIFVVILIPILGVAGVAGYMWYRANENVKKAEGEDRSEPLSLRREASIEMTDKGGPAKPSREPSMRGGGSGKDSSSSNAGESGWNGGGDSTGGRKSPSKDGGGGDVDDQNSGDGGSDDDRGVKKKKKKSKKKKRQQESSSFSDSSDGDNVFAEDLDKADRLTKRSLKRIVDTRKPHLTRAASRSSRTVVSPRRMDATKVGATPRAAQRLELRAEMRAKRQAKRKMDALKGRTMAGGGVVRGGVVTLDGGANASPKKRSPRRASLTALTKGQHKEGEHRKMAADFLRRRLNVAVGDKKSTALLSSPLPSSSASVPSVAAAAPGAAAMTSNPLNPPHPSPRSAN